MELMFFAAFVLVVLGYVLPRVSGQRATSGNWSGSDASDPYADGGGLFFGGESDSGSDGGGGD